MLDKKLGPLKRKELDGSELICSVWVNQVFLSLSSLFVHRGSHVGTEEGLP